MKVSRMVLKQGNAALATVLKQTYFPSIPLKEIFDVLQSAGFLVVAEDGEPWSGFLIGVQDSATFDLKYQGEPVENSVLALSWYKRRPDRYEVCGFLS